MAAHGSRRHASPSLDAATLHVAMLDYLFVIVLYGSIAFWLAVLIDGHIMPAFDPAIAEKRWSITLFAEIVLQIALQGFIVVVATSLLKYVESPVQGVAGYDAHSGVGDTLRNPAIMSVILFALSKSLQARLQFLFRRFDRRGG